MSSIEYIVPGTHVITKIGNIEAIITTVLICLSGITYEISYFCAGENKVCELYEDEFVIKGERKVSNAGFRHQRLDR